MRKKVEGVLDGFKVLGVDSMEEGKDFEREMKRRSVRAGGEGDLLFNSRRRNKNDIFGTPFISNYKVTPKKNEKCNKSAKWTPNEMKLGETQ